MLVTRTSILSGIERTMDLPVTAEQVIAHQNGMVVQNAMPQLNADQREFVMSGITPDEWDATFGEEE